MPVPRASLRVTLVVYMSVVTMIIFKGLNYPYLLYNERVLKLFQDLYRNAKAKTLLFTGKMALLMKNSDFFQRWQAIVALVCCVSL